MPDPRAARPLTALPSVKARVLAFAAILVAGLCGALIGSSFVSLQCDTSCTGASGIGALVGGLFGAGGVAVVAVLTLRAMGEWASIRENERLAIEAEEADVARRAGLASQPQETPPTG